MVSASRNSVNCLSKSLAPTSTDRRTKTRCIPCSRFHSFFLFDISRIRLRIRHRALFRRLRIRYPRPATFSDPAFDHVRAVALDRSARSRNRTTERRRSGRGPLQGCKSAPRRLFDVARSRISHAQILVRYRRDDLSRPFRKRVRIRRGKDVYNASRHWSIENGTGAFDVRGGRHVIRPARVLRISE